MVEYTATMLIAVILIAIALFILWAELMYYFAQQDKKILFGIIYSLGWLAPIITGVIMFISGSNVFEVLIGLIAVAFVIFIGATIYEQAGRKKKVWYYLTLVFPILAIVYQITKE